jgi:hypothetical protein
VPELPRFFDKSALAAAQVLSNFDLARFQRFLADVIIEVAFDDSATMSAEGKKTLDLLVRLLSRLYPRLLFSPTGEKSTAWGENLVTIARAINPRIELSQPGTQPTLAIVVGATAPSHSAVRVFAGSQGWICKFSQRNPVGSGHTENPFGAGAAACVATANAFRHVFKDQLFEPGFDDELAWSLYDYELGRCDDPAIKDDADLGRIHLVGLGAVGNGALWALLNSRLKGSFELIDPEPVDLGNLQRYVMALDSDEGRPKSILGEELLTKAGFTAIPHVENWSSYLDRTHDWDLQVVAVSVDSAKDRYELQGSLPRWICNAWTQHLNLGVSRHSFIDENACLMCLYFPRHEVPSEDTQIANAIGFKSPTELMEVRVMLYRGTPVDRSLVERIATAKQIPVDPLLPFVGKSLREFYSRAVCGGLIFSLNPGSSEVGQPVPIAFQSALAGIMMIAELTKHCLGMRVSPPPVTTTVNLLKPLGNHFSVADKKTDVHCICRDADFIQAFNRRWSHPKGAQ